MYVDGYGECKRLYIANVENKLLARLILDEKMDWIVEQGKKLDMRSCTSLFGYYGFVFEDEGDRDDFIKVVNDKYGAIVSKHTDDTVLTKDGKILTDVPNIN